MSEQLIHTTVLLHETVEMLPLAEGKLFVDCTMGGGGHSSLILQSSDAHLIAVDKDEQAFGYAKQKLAPYEDRVTFVKSDFKDIKSVLAARGITQIDGAVLDLGVSSFQLDDAERGFSYMKDAPIDMRMDRDAAFSAYDVVNGYDKQQLAKVIFDYGEEKFGNRIADAIIKNRPIESTLQLSEVIRQAIPAANRRTGPHPAKRTFQAIRIEVNGELKILEQAIKDGAELLKKGGKMGIITFHSLEDRIVKTTFASLEKGCTCPKDFPVCVCGNKPSVKSITRKPIVPSEKELDENPRARSSKLRAVKKII